MDPDPAILHGTDSPAYRLSERIRFGHNRFFLRLIAQVRDGRAFGESDRVLDIGCGDAAYFSKLWGTIVPEFGRPYFVHGIDKKKIEGKDSLPVADSYRLEEADFFEFRANERFDFVYSSFCHTWLRAPQNPSETEADRDDMIACKLRSLLKPNGWFAAHYAGVENYFPYYNRLILDALRKIGHPLADQKLYWGFRKGFLRPPSLDTVRDTFKRHEFTNTFAAKSIEWVPVRKQSEFLAYFESGGRNLLEQKLGSKTYQHIRDIIAETIESHERLQALGIRSFRGDPQASEFILLPTYHTYHIAQLRTGTMPGNRRHDGSPTSKQTAMSLAAVAAFQSASQSKNIKGIQAVAGVINDFLVQDNRDAIYLGVIEAGGVKRRVESSWYAKNFEARKPVVGEGAALELPTLTNVIFRRSEDNIIAAFAHVTDDHSSIHGQSAFTTEGDMEIEKFWAQLTFLWPNRILPALFDSDGVVLGESDALRVVLSRLELGDDWPRLLVNSETAFALAKELERPSDLADLTGPLRYFLWQSRVAGPNAFSFLVFPQRLRRLGVDGSHTCFLMWRETAGRAPRVTERECALLLAMQQLAVIELGQESGRKKGHKEAISAESHEARLVAVAVREWPVHTNCLFDIAVNPVQPQGQSTKLGMIVPYKRACTALFSIEDLALVPFPDLYRAATSYLVGWCLTELPADLPFWTGDVTALPTSLAQLTQHCWASVLNVALMHWRRDRFYADADDNVVFARWRDSVLRALEGSSPKLLPPEVNLPLAWANPAGDSDPIRASRSIWLARLLMHLSREHLEHGDLSKPPQLTAICAPANEENGVPGRFSVTLEWSSRKQPPQEDRPIDDPIRQLVEGLRTTKKEWRFDVNSGLRFKGRDVKRFLARKIDEQSKVTTSPKSHDPYLARFEFTW